ncbi:MAG TPA: hypothetical protein VH120_01550, partial [Gemmataceae bacterium]|nr:hypothetical protein [Gemmataceae bacterium]
MSPGRTCRMLVVGVVLSAALAADKPKPLEIVLVDPSAVDAAQVAAWKADRFSAVALVLDDRQNAAVLKSAADAAAANGLGVYLWIEIGRNAELAREHPEWMASLGMHSDWRKRFPNVRPPEKSEVAKAWPWVPIGYKESFAAHR